MLVRARGESPQCAPGMYLSSDRGCQWCPPGSYQHAPGMNYCIPCKKGMVSQESGAVSAKTCRNCARGTYAISNTECIQCPLNTISPAGATGILECSAISGHYAIPGGIGMECPANHYCVQGTTEPTPCPKGTISTANSVQCLPGIRSVIFLDWVFGSAWIILFLGGVIALGMYKHILAKALNSPPNHEQLTPKTPPQIQIKINR